MFDDMSPLTFDLYKSLKYLAYPLTWIWLLMLVTAILVFCRQTPGRLTALRMTALSAFLLLHALSTGTISASLAGMLEQMHPPYTAETDPDTFDAIIVLSGTMFPQGGARPAPELDYVSLQRTLCAARAYAEKRGPRLVISGGVAASVEMSRLALALGVPEEALIQERISRNTYESAKEVTRLLSPGNKTLLITSAIHMPRAMGLFRGQGLDVTAYPCGYLTARKPWAWPRALPNVFMPDVHSLERSTRAIKELTGLAVYRVAGKL